MTTKQLEQIVHMKPFKPYRLVLDSGEEVLVDRPRKSHVSGSFVSLLGDVTPKPGAPTVEKFRIINVNQVVSARHVDVPIREH